MWDSHVWCHMVSNWEITPGKREKKGLRIIFLQTSAVIFFLLIVLFNFLCDSLYKIPLKTPCRLALWFAIFEGQHWRQKMMTGWPAGWQPSLPSSKPLDKPRLKKKIVPLLQCWSLKTRHNKKCWRLAGYVGHLVKLTCVCDPPVGCRRSDRLQGLC